MAMGALSLAGNTLNMGLSLFQMLHGNAMRKRGMNMFNNTPFPEYTIPKELSTNQSIAEHNAMIGMPSPEREAALNDINANQSFSVKNINARGGNIGDINSIDTNSNNAKLGLEGESAQMRLANSRTLMNANSQMASYRDKAYQINRLQRYLMRMGMASSLMQSGNEGFNSGLNALSESLSSGSNSAGDIMQNGGFKNAFGDMFGSGGGSLGSGGAASLASSISIPDAIGLFAI